MNAIADWKANREGQPLLDHARLVGRLAREMGRQAGLEPSILDQIECAGYAHDLGKACRHFQACLQRDGEDSSDLDLPRHHEISWAFLTRRFSLGNYNEPVFQAVYWHHARPISDRGDYFETRDAIWAQLDEAERARLERLAEALELPKLLRAGEPHDRDERVPPLLWDDGTGDATANARAFAIRTCLIAADRCVSGMSLECFHQFLSEKQTLSDYVKNLIGSFSRPSFACPAGYDERRFQIQRKCAEDARGHRTTAIRAPAGFGKTMVGLLWGLGLGQRMLWVCPRNVVAEAVYENARREAAALNVSLSMELHLSGRRQRHIGDATEFASDIVVTNIDTILNPMVDNRCADRLFTVLASAVVFDEYHEFVSEAPLFAAFVTLMRARHRLCANARTMLLSATPSCLQVMWDADGQKTEMLPDENNHYPPAHAGRYRFALRDGLPPPLPGSLTVVNSVSRCQELYRNCHHTHIVHSRFTDADRSRKIEALFRDFGKNGDGVKNGKTAVSALVIQSAMDVSFAHLCENVYSPEATLQRIGRCDRWGGFQKLLPSITLVSDRTANEESAIRTVYDIHLRDVWWEYLRREIGAEREMSLAELYSIYNRYCQHHRSEIHAFLKNCYRQGLGWLTEYAPVKFKRRIEEGAKPGRAARSLRNPLGTYFFSVRRTDGGWLGPDELLEEGQELRWRFDEPDRQRRLMDARHMRPCLKALYEAGFQRFRRYLKRQPPPATPDRWFRLARSEETPLPDFTREYDSEVGLKERSDRR